MSYNSTDTDTSKKKYYLIFPEWSDFDKVVHFKSAWTHFFTQLNDFIYFYQIRIILFVINPLFAHS